MADAKTPQAAKNRAGALLQPIFSNSKLSYFETVRKGKSESGGLKFATCNAETASYFSPKFWIRDKALSSKEGWVRLSAKVKDSAVNELIGILSSTGTTTSASQFCACHFLARIIAFELLNSELNRGHNDDDDDDDGSNSTSISTKHYSTALHKLIQQSKGFSTLVTKALMLNTMGEVFVVLDEVLEHEMEKSEVTIADAEKNAIVVAIQGLREERDFVDIMLTRIFALMGENCGESGNIHADKVVYEALVAFRKGLIFFSKNFQLDVCCSIILYYFSFTFILIKKTSESKSTLWTAYFMWQRLVMSNTCRCYLIFLMNLCMNTMNCFPITCPLLFK